MSKYEYRVDGGEWVVYDPEDEDDDSDAVEFMTTRKISYMAYDWAGLAGEPHKTEYRRVR